MAEQILVSSCSSAGDCGGGYPSGAANFIRDTGLPLEGCFSYTAMNDVCRNACPNWQNNSFRIKKWLYVSTWSPTIENIKAALFDFGPLPTTLDVYSDFFSYRAGIYSLTPGCCNDRRVCPNCHYEGGHAVLIVGYDDEEEYFIVKNSWGTGWGESGYFKIDYSQLANEVEFGYYTIAYETEADIKSRLTVLKAGVGRGDIIAEGLTCYEEFCDGEYLTGATITVTAQAAPGYVLDGWEGCDSIIDQSCVINLTHDMTATATFLPPPRMYVTPRSLQFGSVKKGIQSSTQSLIVQNAGGARLAISSLEIAGTNGSDFSFQNDCSEMIFAGETCTINVTTTPAGYGKLFGEMKIYSNDLKKQPYHVAKLTANAKAPKIAVRPYSMRFEPILAGIASGTKSITLENKGLSDLMILGVNTDNISDFSFVNNCPSILESGSSCTMDFNFVPIDAGTKAGSITINSNDPKKPSVIAKFTGKGE